MAVVYLVEGGDYEQRCVVGIYTTREAALATGVEGRGDVSLMGLDDVDVLDIPCWWDVSYSLGALGRGHHRWQARSWGDAGRGNQTLCWLQWPDTRIPRNDRVDIEVWAPSKREAIEKGKSQLRGATVPIHVYNGQDHPPPWRQIGEGIPYP